jgi:transposase InsO family protein
VYEQRLAMIHRVVTLKRSVSDVAREFGVSRKTAHKWLKRFRQRQAGGVHDRPRRPKRSPDRTDNAVERAVLDVRERHHWGPRKIHRVLEVQEQAGLPSVRTVASILRRSGCVPLKDKDELERVVPPRPFERGAPNELWQLDHKGAVEVARQRVVPLTVLDDHSRYCLCFRRVNDLTMKTTWAVLWDLFGTYGLPDSILCDNAFSAPTGLSWFDANLVRLDVRPIHGQPYHPQTQGKVERFHGSAQRELIDFDGPGGARRDSFQHFDEDAERWRMTYNTLRPHEAIGDVPPVTRWRRSGRERPPTLPTQVTYPPGTVTRRVSQAGDFRYRNARITVGRALTRETISIEEREHDIAVYYSWKLLRVIPQTLLGGPRSHQIV